MQVPAPVSPMMNFNLPQASAHPEAEFANGAVMGLLKYLQDRQDLKEKMLTALMPQQQPEQALKMAASQGLGTFNQGQPAMPEETINDQSAQAHQSMLGGAAGPLPAQVLEAQPATESYLDINGQKIYPSGMENTRMENAQSNKTAKGAFQAIKDDMGKITGWVNPATQQVVKPSDIEGLTPDMLGTPISSNTKTMMETAPKVTALAKKVDAEVDKVAAKLGAAGGRWSDMWTGRVGASDPDYMKLKTDAGLLSTALMKMHVGARGSEKIMEKFDNLIGLGHQSPENMKAAMQEITEYANLVAGHKEEKPSKNTGDSINPDSVDSFFGTK